MNPFESAIRAAGSHSDYGNDDEEIPDGPPAVKILPWLRCNLGPTSLAPLTSTDTLALQAAVQVAELYNFTGDPAMLKAFADVVGQMQAKCFRFAYHAIAHVANWEDRSKWWKAAGLPPIENPGRCKYEPGGTAR